MQFKATPLLLRILVICAITLHGCNDTASTSNEYFVYVASGEASDGVGITALKWSSADATLTTVYHDSSLSSTSYLAVDTLNKTLYSVGSEGVSAFRVNQQTGRLNLINTVANRGHGPCHVSLATHSDFLYVAYYNSGSVAVFALEPNGAVGDMVDMVAHMGSSVNAARQESAHVHMVKPVSSSELILVPDLGIDRVNVYRVDEKGKLILLENGSISVQPGSGPRHVAIHPNRRWVYVLYELTGKVGAFTFDPEQGFGMHIATHDLLSSTYKDDNKSADIHVSGDGRFLYASNRGPNDLAVFAIEPKGGTLSKVDNLSSGGEWPRAFTFSPNGNFLWVANKYSNQISVLKIDTATGRYHKINEVKTSVAPQSICIISGVH